MFTYIFPLYLVLGQRMKISGPYMKRHPFICFLVDARTGKILDFIFSAGRAGCDMYFRAMMALRFKVVSDNGSRLATLEAMLNNSPFYFADKPDMVCDTDRPDIQRTFKERKILTFIDSHKYGAIVLHHVYELLAQGALDRGDSMSIAPNALALLLQESVGQINAYVAINPSRIAK
ncbi:MULTISPECIES: hypothetical protein [unclassified Pseudomonas]|uniref:hypothetical protein n=1 Tax=unclassified Pseudomonas TaxID=196821 RepID=UPI001AE64908|nr:MULTISPECIES: hypothetical protein [unclassified Pseudomonas]MBP2271332.1 hypothetical protein [Pseudomonas sp. BP6]MBP2289697.1 hypothetical protein [Pseudomonas sp. BP7]HDS1696525.1 hypothetical protein [Pseudomonas putida]HDS1701516.1 hypothetical protein [Pseudomonas putida]